MNRPRSPRCCCKCRCGAPVEMLRGTPGEYIFILILIGILSWCVLSLIGKPVSQAGSNPVSHWAERGRSVQ